MKSSVTQELADFVAKVRFEDLPEQVVHESKRLLLDSVGCGLAGLQVEKGKIAVELARQLGGAPEATILGLGGKVSFANASFANGELINALDYDVISDPPAHAAPYLIPASLSTAEFIGGSGKDLLLAIAIGHEISRRLSEAMSGIEDSSKAGLKAIVRSATTGLGICAIGGTLAVAKLLNLDHYKLSSVIGLAAHFTPLPTRPKTMSVLPQPATKYLSAGWLSHTEVIAALLAHKGYDGDSSALDGDLGYWRSLGAKKWQPKAITQQLGDAWFFPKETIYKPYPCCRLMHTSLDCLTKIIVEERLLPEDIVNITVWLNAHSPHWQNRIITNQIDAQFSAAYVLSVATHRVRVGAEWQNLSTINNQEILEFMDKIIIKPYPEAAKAAISEHPMKRMGAIVEVTAKGEKFREERWFGKGDPISADTEMKDEELIEKFRNNASQILPWNKIDKAGELIMQLEKIENISTLLKQVSLQSCTL
ncbi:MmgE/PrpD family protein [Chloroflexota bacterium]